MIYLDSSALLKLVVTEAETGTLTSWLAERADTTWVSSELASVEVVRAARRLDEDAVPAARILLERLDVVPLTGVVVRTAQDLRPAALRSLDALHLASALLLREDLTAFVAYDARLAGAAQDAGLATASPGR